METKLEVLLLGEFKLGTMSKSKKSPIPKFNIDVSLFDYMKGVSTRLQEPFTDNEEQSLFVSNVFHELEGKEIKLCCHQTLSRTLEALINIADAKNVNKFLNGLLKDLPFVATHWLASHVLESCLSRLRIVCQQEEDISGSEGECVLVTVVKVCDLIKSHLHEFITHQYASHVLRAFLEMLSGLHVAPLIGKAKYAKHQEPDNSEIQDKQQQVFYKNNNIRQAFLEVLDKIFHKSSLGSFMKNNFSSLVIQASLLICSEVDARRFSTQCETIFALVFENNCKAYICNESSSHIIEVMLPLLSEDMWPDFLSRILTSIPDFSTNKHGNFVVQRLISTCRLKSQFVNIYCELEDHFEAVLAAGHAGILVALGKGCVEHRSKQKEYYKQLLAAFHCHDETREKKFVYPLLSLCTYDVYFGENEGNDNSNVPPTLSDINLHGALIAQSLLAFKKQEMSSSLLGLLPVELKCVSCHPCGSHVIDACFTSTKVSAEQKQEVTSKLVGFYSDLACNKHGSRTLEVIWRESEIKIREIIGSDLLAQEGKIKHDRFGKYIYSNFHLEHYKYNVKEWRSNQMNREKRGRTLEEFVGELAEQTSAERNVRKKKRKKTVE